MLKVCILYWKATSRIQTAKRGYWWTSLSLIFAPTFFINHFPSHVTRFEIYLHKIWVHTAAQTPRVGLHSFFWLLICDLLVIDSVKLSTYALLLIDAPALIEIGKRFWGLCALPYDKAYLCLHQLNEYMRHVFTYTIIVKLYSIEVHLHLILSPRYDKLVCLM